MAPAVHPIGERVAGHRELARSGRRLELLTALGAV
jgi:hypothetical protein